MKTVYVVQASDSESVIAVFSSHLAALEFCRVEGEGVVVAEVPLDPIPGLSVGYPEGYVEPM